MSEPRHQIWGDIHLDYEEWRDDLEAEHPDWTDDERIQLMHDTNRDYLDDERMNLDIQLPRAIMLIADMERWNGRYIGFRMIDSGNIKDCLYTDCDTAEWYVDKLGDLRCTAHHHDGTNHYLYRAIKPDATDGQIEWLQSRLYLGQVKRGDITRVTERLGDHIGAVYGWRFPRVGRTTPERSASGNIFKSPKNSPWGEVQTCDTLSPGVFLVSTSGHGGAMVAKEAAAFLSPAARKCGFREGGYLCFEEDSQEAIVLRELMDKGLWTPTHTTDKEAFEDRLNEHIREYNPDYWRSRQSGRQNAAPRCNIPAQQVGNVAR